MAKKSKIKTPDWILEGKSENSGTKKKKGKTFKVRRCPKCNSDDVGLVLTNSDSEEGGGREWECHKCKWKGSDIKEEELSEDKFMKYLDEKGEEVA